ncbi:MAG TPA: hypothetical protein V6D06_13250 [Trichocoleus sp.]
MDVRRGCKVALGRVLVTQRNSMSIFSLAEISVAWNANLANNRLFAELSADLENLVFKGLLQPS